MRVVIIGSGNVATVLGRMSKRAGHELVQVVSRKLVHAKALAEELQCAFTDSYTAIDSTADIYILAVADEALNELHEAFHVGDKLVVHTAGAVSKNILRNVSLKYGVLYPLQSIRKEMNEIPSIPLLVDGNTEDTTVLIEAFATTISSLVGRAGDEQRTKLHVAAVVVNNFTNHLFALAEDYCTKEGLDFKMLVPLIKETADRVAIHPAASVQTGPAIRNDISTLDKHLRLLTDHPRLKYIYLKITDSIMNR